MRAIYFIVGLICAMGFAVWAWESLMGYLEERAALRRATEAFKPIEDELERMWNNPSKEGSK